jgi:tryptophan synthase beta chain
MEPTKILLNENEIPTSWYNVQADLPKPLPPILHPGTKEPTILPPPLFSSALNEQEFSKERYIAIPEEILQYYRLYRPTPLYRAHRQEKTLGTPAHIYYKYEGVSPVGSHKLNTAIAQAYYNKKEGIKRLSTETGAGQWGTALSVACNFFGLECKVYMVKVSYNQKPYRRVMMQAYGATVVPSPSPDTNFGRKVLAETPDSPGSLGVAISEAVEDAATRDDTHYTLGSVLNHVLLHQTVIGLECKKQLEKTNDYPDFIIGCVGGGSNFGGIFLPFVPDKLKGKKIRFVGVEPTSCPSITKGPYTWDYGDCAGMAPIAKMHTLGHNFMPPGIHAGGLRYHGMAPLVSHCVSLGIAEARAVPQLATFQAALTFARSEGLIPAPESAHAIKAAIDEALKCKEEGKGKTILVNLSGHGFLDLGAYEQYLAGKLEDYEYPAEMVQKALFDLPKVTLA